MKSDLIKVTILIIDNIFKKLGGRQGHKVGVRGTKKSSGGIPPADIKLFCYFQNIQNSVKLPHFC